MNSLFNSALRQSNAIAKDLDAFSESASPSPALQGQLTASLTTFNRTLDDYARSASQELVSSKASKAQERLVTFRTSLSEYRSRFEAIKLEQEEKTHAANRNELFSSSSGAGGGGGGGGGHYRRPHGSNTSMTPENPYSENVVSRAKPSTGTEGSLFRTRDGFVTAPSSGGGGGGGGGNPYSAYSMSSPSSAQQQENNEFGARESHAFREQNFFASTNATLDEYLERGRAVLGDLGEQKDMLKGTQKKLYSVANTLGVSGDTIRMVERRAKQDKWIFWVGVVVFVGFVWVVFRWVR